jgi:hypothetical protein
MEDSLAGWSRVGLGEGCYLAGGETQNDDLRVERSHDLAFVDSVERVRYAFLFEEAETF